MTFRRWLSILGVALSLVFACVLSCSGSTQDQDGGRDGSIDERQPDGGPGKAESGVGDSGDADASDPYLVELSVSATVTGDGGGPVELFPAFAPDLTDYSVYCARGTNVLTVTMRASSGAESVLLLPTKSPALPKQTLAVHVDENAAIVAAARSGSATKEYWVRCLPHDFPHLTWTPHPEAGAPTPGYYLLGTYSAPAGEAGYAMVLDSHGVPVWYDALPDKIGMLNVDTQVSGTISFIRFPSSAPYEIHRLSPASITNVGTPDLDDVHDLRALDGGNFLVFSSPYVDGVDLTGLTATLPDGGSEVLGPNEKIAGCQILELDPSGAVVWMWDALDHFDPVQDTEVTQISQRSGTMGMVFDVFHCNSIDVDPKNGDLLVSARQLDSVFYVERPSGRVLWKMGGPTFTKDNSAYVPVGNRFYGQHDARLLPGFLETCSGAKGQVSVFDDHSFKGGVARGAIYDVQVELVEAGAADCGPSADAGNAGTLIWEYQGPERASGLGSFRVEADGDRVIGWGFGGGPDQLVFTEVDSKGHDLLDLSQQVSYRVIKVPVSAFDLNVLRSTAGKP
jgi:Arylsulfotransferase (ASST)